MDGSFVLWDVKAGNIVGAFDTADEALAIVRHLLNSFGQDYASR